jgi:hypothetical protein
LPPSRRCLRDTCAGGYADRAGSQFLPGRRFSRRTREDLGGVGPTFTAGSCQVNPRCAGDPDGIDSTTTTGNIGGRAGNFVGDINVTGAIFAGTKDSKVDRPLDPANKYLLHASVESSEMKSIYDGVEIWMEMAKQWSGSPTRPGL